MHLTELLTEIFRRHGDAAALRTAGRVWSYTELDRITSALADFIDSRCELDRRVVLVGDHSAEGVVWALAAMRSRAIYTPMNPDWPAQRVNDALAMCDPALVVYFDRESVIASASTTAERVYAPEVTLPDVNLVTGRSASRYAYSIFTSGSTGAPKLVNIGHDGIENLCRSLHRTLEIGTGDSLLQFSSLSFDASISEIFAGLYSGATVVVPQKSQGSWLGAVSAHLNADGCDVLMIAPSIYARLDDGAKRRIGKVQFSAEALKKTQFDEARKYSTVYNAYGPTEGTVCFSIAALDQFEDTIGRPIEGFRAFVHPEDSNTLDTVGEGELVIVGSGVALGYEGAREQDRTVFTRIDGRRAYKSGDRVSIAGDGRLRYLGRIDEQIKRFGHRVNIVHVEADLATKLDHSVAMVAFDDELVMAATTGRGDAGTLMKEIREMLPFWEVPDRIEILDELPLATSGKLDKSALRKQLESAVVVTASLGDGGADRAAVEEVVKDVLGESIDPGASLFDAGGNSLAMMRIQVRLSAMYGEDTVENAFDAMEYDFSINGFLRCIHGGDAEPRQPAAQAVYEKVNARLSTLRTELAYLSSDARAGTPRVLVTGVSGFVGGHVFDQLLSERGVEVLVVSASDPAESLRRHGRRFDRVDGEYRSVRAITYDSLAAAIENGSAPAVSAVVHCGYDVNHRLPLEQHLASSVENCVVVAKAAAAGGAGSFVFLSAASVSREFGPFTQENLASIADPYSQSKFVAETYVDALREVGCEVRVLRTALIYGHQESDRRFLVDDWFSTVLRLSLELRVLPRFDGYIPVCDVRTVARDALTAVHGSRAGSAVIVHRTYSLDEVELLVGLDDDAVVPVAEWLDRVRDHPGTDHRLVPVLQAALGGSGWPHPVPGHDILTDVVALLSAPAPV
ncbi:hypothetical protein CH293_26490 [Rhodococcus sp. 14-2470-1b]|uniref:AMP-binding protein n=1 Tax=Rhodococcus sp. 14-2470-1b TaxID=2023149 RepID=UPI000B9BFE91|nr:AMP-binding protein [Rhodococcus sp. 14-2470-1b]OZF42280.1 hypothetical protein CH293_26490 [Rhodococcus sp. 14-2470-1b]